MTGSPAASPPPARTDAPSASASAWARSPASSTGTERLPRFEQGRSADPHTIVRRKQHRGPATPDAAISLRCGRGAVDRHADALRHVGIVEGRLERQLAGVVEALIAEAEVGYRRPVERVARS